MSQTTLMEEGAPPCPECKGDGVVPVRETACHHSQPCPCDSGEEVCPRCEGTKVDTCDHCGEPSTKLDWFSREPICDECAGGSEDGPMGGMGFGIDYAPALESARLLK